MSGSMHESMADGDFFRARTKELLGRIAGIFSRSRKELLALDQVLAILKPTNETYTGLQAIPVDRIVGSEGRYRDFDGQFLPRKDHLRSRWVHVDMAHYQDVVLPPVRLYEIGGVYFVRDGNHRVSVARLQGQAMIDAEVTSLSAEIGLDPDMDLNEMRKALLAWEKRMFYLKTEYDLVTGTEDLDFTTPGRYDCIYEHILVHKYYINQNRSDEIDFGEALLSWHKTVYRPVIDAIMEEGLLASFPGRTASDLYLFISAHWIELSRKYGLPVGIDEAARDFRSKYGSGIRHSILMLASKIRFDPGFWKIRK